MLKLKFLDKLIGSFQKNSGHTFDKGDINSLETVFLKELSDQLSSIRYVILFSLIALTGVVSFSSAASNIRAATE
ncbi:MAG TPA: hypothetical protein GXZ27_00810, partial [Thermoanaerobacterales bacterium]|nr:hypothetical protein [Thermoanaerobacterales bacterium]